MLLLLLQRILSKNNDGTGFLVGDKVSVTTSVIFISVKQRTFFNFSSCQVSYVVSNVFAISQKSVSTDPVGT